MNISLGVPYEAAIKNMSAGTNHTNKLLTYRSCNKRNK